MSKAQAQLQRLLDREMTRKEFLAFSVFAVASVFGVVGLVKTLMSHAATPTASVEPEGGTRTGNATAVNDAGASGGAAIQFNSASSGIRSVTHGSQLLTTDVGPWALQGVAKGNESLDTPATPSRGYWQISNTAEFAVSGTYVYNNNPSNKGGIVPAGGMTIDGYAIPAGTVVIQFRDFSASDFSAQGQGGSYLFRGCRFRGKGIGQSSQFNDYTATYTNRLFFCDMGARSANNADWLGSFWKAIGGTGHIMFRNYCSYQYVTFQPNVPNCQFVENYVEKLIFYYGETGLPDGGGPAHMACLGCEGGGSGFRILRNKIIPASPDEGGNVYTNGSTIAMENTNGQPYTNCQISDNYLSGFNYVILDMGEVTGSTNITITGNQITTRWFTNGGVSGVEQAGPHPVPWGSNGNVKSNNTWADDYGSGGNGTAATTANRQYPTGNGPRTGQIAF